MLDPGLSPSYRAAHSMGVQPCPELAVFPPPWLENLGYMWSHSIQGLSSITFSSSSNCVLSILMLSSMILLMRGVRTEWIRFLTFVLFSAAHVPSAMSHLYFVSAESKSFTLMELVYSQLAVSPVPFKINLNNYLNGTCIFWSGWWWRMRLLLIALQEIKWIRLLFSVFLLLYISILNNSLRTSLQRAKGRSQNKIMVLDSLHLIQMQMCLD